MRRVQSVARSRINWRIFFEIALDNRMLSALSEHVVRWAAKSWTPRCFAPSSTGWILVQSRTHKTKMSRKPSKVNTSDSFKAWMTYFLMEMIWWLPATLDPCFVYLRARDWRDVRLAIAALWSHPKWWSEVAKAEEIENCREVKM